LSILEIDGHKRFGSPFVIVEREYWRTLVRLEGEAIVLRSGQSNISRSTGTVSSFFYIDKRMILIYINDRAFEK
jgi:hypothetical protein